ncbi:MAG: sigma-70 family RNA polymerase sigma factor [Clostridia bacterium]|nr:sigma-70 family RNA polymerase sigma factor [Clostridia bacterium]
MNFEEVQRQYWNLIYQRCLYALFFDEKLAFQITQEVFVALWRKHTKVHPDRVEAWLRKTAKHKIMQVQAKHTRSQLILSLNSEILTDHTQEGDIVDRITDEKVLRNMDLYIQQIYAKLTDDELKLAEYKRAGRQYREIAALMGTTETAISMRASRLRKKLKRIIHEIIEGIL